jgi:2-desacetyl-2-hydroxyethyl bacteriochlorophyllide A dehydrogenase
MAEMRALAIAAPGHVEVVSIPMPDRDARALVRISVGGICGSDLKTFRGLANISYPRVLGHELVGTVVEAGAYRAFAEGTRVLVNPAESCRRCPPCRNDHANLCARATLLGREVDGGFAEYLAIDESRLLAVPPSVAEPDAGLLQVLGTCVHAQTLVDAFPGETAVVVGLGVSGLLHLQLLRARGVTQVVGVTRSAAKRELGIQLGALATCHPDQAQQCVKEIIGGSGADIVVESVGTVETLAQSIELAGPAARVLSYGSIRADEGRLEFLQLYQKELRVIAARGARTRDYAAAIDLACSGAIALAPLVSTILPLDRGPDAFAAASSDPSLVKVLLKIPG